MPDPRTRDPNRPIRDSLGRPTEHPAERRTRAQQRASEIDISPQRLAAEIARLVAERDKATELARKAVSEELEAAEQGRAEALHERDEYLAALQRERAEFLNFKRRTAEQREATLGLAAEGLIRKVLALADDFDRAIETRPDTIADDPWVEGITAIDRKLRQLLESEGVTPIEAVPGDPFDPRIHEAVANVPNTGRPDGEIVEELRRGYKLRDRVIRPAMVAVAEQDPDSQPLHSQPVH
jgi:molecular chaperone GrpE